MNPVNQILRGDCVQVLKSLPDEAIDLVVTDPPYLVNYRDKTAERSGMTAEALNFLGRFRICTGF